jgi:hypothetical protein
VERRSLAPEAGSLACFEPVKVIRQMSEPVLDFDKYKFLTFDCYGTLVDWEQGI